MNEELMGLQLEQLEEELFAKEELISELRDIIRNQDNLHFAILTELYNTDNYTIEITSENNIRIYFYDNKYNRRESTSALKLFKGQWEHIVYMTGDYNYVLQETLVTEQMVFEIIRKRRLYK